MSKNENIVLILCVDRDDDIGSKIGKKGPIIGKDENLKVASSLLLKDPEESDGNAIFGAIKIFDSMNYESKKQKCQIATITGSEVDGIKADIQIKEQLIEVLKDFPAKNVVLVTDGFSDETVIPIIQSNIPIMSVKRIIVKHSESIEESWALLFRYIKKLIEDPNYSRWVLGVPGIMFVAFSLLWFFNQIEFAGRIFLIFLGVILAIKGFEIDKKVTGYVLLNPINLIRVFTMMVSLTIIALDSYQTYLKLIITVGEPSFWLSLLPKVVGYTVQYSLDFLIIASCVYLFGIGVYFYLKHDVRFWWVPTGIIVSIWMREILLKSSKILIYPEMLLSSYFYDLLMTIVIGIITTVVIIFVISRISKHFGNIFKVGKDEKN